MLKSSILLYTRQILGLLLSFLVLFFAVKLLGPRKYGIYSSVVGVQSFLQILMMFGCNTYFYRRSISHLSDVDGFFRIGSVLIFFLVVSVIPAFFAVKAIFAFLHINDIVFSFIVVFNSFVASIVQIPTFYMEKSGNFKRIATNELISQIIFVVSSIYAIRVLGSLELFILCISIQNFFIGVLGVLTGRVKFKFKLSVHDISEYCKFLLLFTPSNLVWNARSLVNPILVGRYLGFEAVGIIGLALRLMDVASSGKIILSRMSNVSLLNDKHSTSEVLVKLFYLSCIFVLAPFLFIVTFEGFIPVFLGDKWVEVSHVIVFIAIGFAANGLINPLSIFVTLKSKMKYIVYTNFLYITIITMTFLFMFKKYGIIGYAIAELLTTFSYFPLLIIVGKIANRRIAIMYGVSLVGFSLICLLISFKNSIIDLTVVLALIIGIYLNYDIVIRVISKKYRELM